MQTWYGRFDVIIGKTAAYEQNGLKKKRCESLVAATTVSEEYNDDSSDEDDYFQNEAKPDNLDGHLSELISQTIVFSMQPISQSCAIHWSQQKSHPVSFL